MLGFFGWALKTSCAITIHFEVGGMLLAEDIQLIAGHIEGSGCDQNIFR